MSQKKNDKTRTIPYRRKRQGKTHYKRRLNLLKSGMPRIVIRKSLNTITTQVVEYHPDGDKILASATSQELKKHGWKMHKASLPSSYLTGLLLGVKAKKKKLGNMVVDIGLQTPNKGGKLFAVLKGVVDAGVELDCSKDALPSDDRVSGKHIAEYANKMKADPQKYQKQFSRCIKEGAKPEDIGKQFDETKKKIMSI